MSMRSSGTCKSSLRLVLITAVGLCTASPVVLAQCANTLTAEVVAFDQVFFWNRLGAVQPQGMMFALKRDVVSLTGASLTAGRVVLRSDKRPRPIVLRVNAGDCIAISFTNLLSPAAREDQIWTRTGSVHVQGMALVGSILSDGSNVASNPSSLLAPDGTATYTYYADPAAREGAHLMYNAASTTSGEGDGGSISAGLFGAVIVEPPKSEWYRSQVTASDLDLATKRNASGAPMLTPDGHPIVDYDAVYPAGTPYAGLPILKMVQSGRLVHSDLTAVITGPGHGNFPAGTYPPNPVYPNRNQPFREFTTIFHDEIGARQSFRTYFEDPNMANTLQSVRDGFAINYGSAGAGAEVLANRLGVGPTKDCVECKYEEFFLSSWAVGDPAMVVDIPANIAGPSLKATKAFFPDDPSNVYHSYIGDHVKFRNLHAGPKEHHIFHLHTHQWLHTPDSDNSSYMDSQTIGPGSAYTYEIAYGGSGNRNKTVGDAIFHCHFYPHFAQGMWALWRSHDVFEPGTKLGADGVPLPGSRALPDGEIAAGTPIPAVVPMPGLAMAPLPGTGGNPGYPFFVAGVAGHRPPHPPLDTVDDGGLPRHVITSGTAVEAHTRTDFSKVLQSVTAVHVPETGTPTELAAMNFHAKRTHTSFTPEGQPAAFITNGLPGAAGAPFADPCVDDAGRATGTPRTYKAAAFQTDIVMNKAGWHNPQSRMLALWHDVRATQNGTKAPEPLFFRANTGDCISFYHTNLVPSEYKLDDFQIRTPTDVVGQHIHLVKFDVTASDGSGNGFNYEDGSFSPDEVIERIRAINAVGGMQTTTGARKVLTPKPHPYFGTPGAQTTVQRWYVDDTLNNAGQDRTLRTVFTHDHFGPSTHQQLGLYAGLVVEPKGSTWRDPESGVTYGTRADGGPTSWRADILTDATRNSYREFLLEFQDYQLAFDRANVSLNPPGRTENPSETHMGKYCPGSFAAPPCPEAVSAQDSGTMTVNYRNEPLALRVRDPLTGRQAAGAAGDLALAFSSRVLRADPLLNLQSGRYPPLTKGLLPGDPYTPLMRMYESDSVQIRVLVGAHEESHNITMNGLKWLFEPSDPNSGYRASQPGGLSEHFEFNVHRLDEPGKRPWIDHLWKAGASVEDLWNGLWGLLRVYDKQAQKVPDLLELPGNVDGHTPSNPNLANGKGVCPANGSIRHYDVVAIPASALPGGTLMYNSRVGLNDPTAIIYVRAGDLDANGKLKPGVPIEPLILRASAGECVEVALTNQLPLTPRDNPGYSGFAQLFPDFNAIDLAPSTRVGLHPQLVAYWMAAGDDGTAVGSNEDGTVMPGFLRTYHWYAGDVSVGQDGTRYTPIEFGATNLMPADPLKHSSKGAVGALIIEPQGSTWVEDAASRAQATVTSAAGSFREFVLIFQDDLNLLDASGQPVRNNSGADDAEDSGQKAFNYRTEPFWSRMGYPPNTPLNAGHGFFSNFTQQRDFTNVLSNTLTGGDPVTPIFTVKRGMPLRFRVLHPGGHSRNHVFQVHGHMWQEEPFVNGSRQLGFNPLSEWRGAAEGVGPSTHMNVLIRSAGGPAQVPGDYLIRDQQSFMFDGGLWAILRVQ